MVSSLAEAKIKRSIFGVLSTYDKILKMNNNFSTDNDENYCEVFIAKDKEWGIKKQFKYYTIRLMNHEIICNSEKKVISVKRFPIKNSSIEGKGYSQIIEEAQKSLRKSKPNSKITLSKDSKPNKRKQKLIKKT